jgi:hypothetical protein
MFPSGNSTETGNETDFDAGTNAVKFEGDQLGVGPQEIVSFDASPVTYVVGRNRVKFKIKILNQDMVKMWMAVRSLNVDTPQQVYVNLTDVTIGATQQWEATPTITAIGGGWLQFDGVLDMTGFADVDGLLRFYFGEGDNDANIDNETGDVNEIAIYQLTFTAL